MASSFAVERLTGAWALDHHSASQCDPLYDLERAAWIEEWCDEIVGELAVPPLSWPAEVVGIVHRKGAEATGIPEGTPVVAGTIDAWAEALSAGVRARGDAMVMYGSTMFFIAVAEARTTAPGIWTTAGIDPGTRTLAAGTATSGSVTSWLAELVGRGHDELLTRAGQVAAGSEGLLLLPFFAGERTPVPDPRARGVLAGLTLRHGPEHLYRAVLEGTAYGARRNLEALGVDNNTRLVAVGGGAGAELWPQIVSDVTGLSQLVPEETIGAAYGDALLAAEGVGLAPSGHTWARPAQILDPDPAVRPRYDELYDAWLALAEATASAQHLLAAFEQDAS
jgi:xylulokinase